MKKLFCAALISMLGIIAPPGVVASAEADPVQLLPGSGYYTTDFLDPDGTFSSSGTFIVGDLITGIFGRELTANARTGCQPCAPGDLLNLSASFQLRGPRYMSAGATYAVWGEGVLNFTSPTVTIPSTWRDVPEFPLFVYAPFEFTGHVELFRNTDNVMIFGSDVIGSGRTRAILLGDGREWRFHQQQWLFGTGEFDHAPVPEPATIILLGTSLGVAAWRTRQRNCRNV